MSIKQFRFHPEARTDFREAIASYRNRSTSVATEFRVEVSDKIRRIAEAPYRWPKYLHGTRRFVLDRFPFSIIYLDDPDAVIIIAVAHSKRKPGYWKDRFAKGRQVSGTRLPRVRARLQPCRSGSGYLAALAVAAADRLQKLDGPKNRDKDQAAARDGARQDFDEYSFVCLRSR